MKLRLVKSGQFIADFDRQFRYYEEKAGWEIATSFLHAVDATAESLAVHPGLGCLRHFPQPELAGIHSFLVHKPFQVHLIFYRFTDATLELWRIMHGARELPKRPPSGF